MIVLQIHEEMAFAVMPFIPCLIGTKSLFESLDLTPKAVSKYFNKVRTGHKFVGPELGNAGITITEPFSDNWFLAKKSWISQKGNWGLICRKTNTGLRNRKSMKFTSSATCSQS